MLKLSKSFNVGKQRCLLIFISFCSSNVTLIHKECPFICCQLLVFLDQLLPTTHTFIKAFLVSFNSLHVINIFSVSFFTDAGNKSPSNVNLYTTFLYHFNIFRTLSSSVSIFTGFSRPAILKFCSAQIITDSIGSVICIFVFSPILVKGRLYIFFFVLKFWLFPTYI